MTRRCISSRSRAEYQRLALALFLAAATGLLLGPGCVPYPAGTTAHPVDEEDSPTVSTSVYAVPNGLDLLRDSTAFTEGSKAAFVGVDTDLRFRINEETELGVRIPTFSGFIINYKRRVVGTDSSAFALAVMPETGFVNLGQHWHFGATVIASGAEGPLVTPYGGVRGMQVVPLSESAVSDSPTIGGFLGLRIGSTRLGITPEVGLYYDEPALDISADRNVLFVPSLTLHGRGLLSGSLFPGF